MRVYVTSVQNQPSSLMKKISIEVHIFDFHQDIYGHSVIVEWHKRIRSEQKFNGIDELVAQIEKDKQTALEYFYEKAR